MEIEEARAVHPRQAHILVVDDNPVNRKTLARAMENAGHRVSTAENGSQALAILKSSTANTENPPATPPVDVILLDVLMPEMDGFQVLQLVKANSHWQHIPVIMISAVDEMDSVVHCIELGATDYLHKPFKAALLHARLNSSLAAKRLRDLELEYLEQVGRIAGAAEAVEAAAYDPASLNEVARRPDALGRLAHTFQRMAEEVHLREQRLRQQLRQMQMDVDEMKKALSEPASIYLPMDRIHALVSGLTLPERSWGTVLSADISGFTPLTAALTRQLGRQRGAEELTRTLNQVYGALIDTVHRYHGSVIAFSGDAVTCWFGADSSLEALTCGLALQKAMQNFTSITTPSGAVYSLGIKVAVAAGPLQRYLVGDPQVQVIEVLAGKTMDQLADTEKHAQRGEVVAHANALDSIAAGVGLDYVANPDAPFCSVVRAISQPAPERPWPDLSPNALTPEQCRPWHLPEVYERLQTTGKQYLAEFRPVAALFLQFTGLDYDHDPQAGAQLDAFITQTQAVLRRHHGSLIQLTTGDKGSYLYAVFGAPSAHVDSPLHAVRAAMELYWLPRQFPFIRGLNIGISHGEMRVGAYGGDTRRTYGALGEQVNLAARLMQHARGTILCSETITQAAQSRVAFKALGTIQVKGSEEPLAVYRPVGEKHHLVQRSTTLVGRQPEHDCFTRLLQSLLEGRGGVLWISGEPGVGKTRLLAAFEQAARQAGVPHIHRNEGLPEFLQSAIHPPALILLDDAHDHPQQVIAQLLDLARAGQPPHNAVLVVLAASLPPAGVSQTVNESVSDVVHLALPPLNRTDARLLAQNMLGVNNLPEALALLIDHSGGLPFYIEKILDHLLAGGQVILKDGVCNLQDGAALHQLLEDSRHAGPANVFSRLPLSVLPPTVQGLLKSRLEQLSPEEQMGLRLASALGQVFSPADFTALLPVVEQNALAGVDPSSVLAALEKHGLVKCLPSDSPAVPPVYTFTNGLIHSVAYESMLFAQRRALHRHIAERYETMPDASRVPTHQVLAEHWRRAEEMGKAIDYLEKAALQARRAGDLNTAERLLKATLALSAASAVLSQDFRHPAPPENE